MSLNVPTQYIKLDASDYAEQLKLGLPCEEDDRHIAVMYCPDCKADLCVVCSNSIHARKALSKHEPVRLTKKPEPPISCLIHPQRTAELVCKEASCDGMSNPMCIMCHQYEAHKGHKYAILNDEYDRIRSNAVSCLKENETKLAICNKNLDEYDRCISTFHRSDANFMQIERDKIENFYSNVKTSALKTFDNFAKSQIEKLRLSKNQYSCEKNRLDEIRTFSESIEGMKKIEVIKNGENVENLMKQSEKPLNRPANLLPFNCYKVKYPNVGSMGIEMDIDYKELSKYSQHKIPAVHFIYFDSNHSYLAMSVLKAGNVLSVEEKNNGKLYKYKNDRFIFHLENGSGVFTIDSSQYKSIAVMFCDCHHENNCFRELENMIEMGDDDWSRIILVAGHHYYTTLSERIREKFGLNGWLKVVSFEGELKLFNSFFEK